MFKLIGGKIPPKAETYGVKIVNPTTEYEEKLHSLKITYVASPSREHLFATDDDKNLIFAVAVTKNTIKVMDENLITDRVHVYGEPGDGILGILGVVDATNLQYELETGLKRARGSKFPGYKYVELNSKNDDNSVATISGKLEDFIYKNIPIEELTADRDMSWVKRKNYKIMRNRLEIIEWVRGLDATTEIVGFDTETSGLRVNRCKRDVLVGICMSYEDNGGVYFPLRQERFPNIEMDIDEFINLIKPYIDARSPKKKPLVTHNGAFDARVMKMHDIELNLVYDTFIRQSIHKVAEAKNIRTLKGMAKKILGIDVIELDEMYEKRAPKDLIAIKKAIDKGSKVNPITKYKFDTVQVKVDDKGKEKIDMKFNDVLDFRFASEDFVNIYGPADADFPRLIHKYMDATISQQEQHDLEFIYRLEMGVLPIVVEQEYYGVKVIEEGFTKLLKKAQEEKAQLMKDIYELAGEEFNINSSKEKSRIFFEKLGMPSKERYRSKKTKELGTGKAVLEDLIQISTGERDENGELIPKYPIVAKLMRYTKVEKLISSFYDKIPKLVVDGYIFPNYQTVMVETGRLSSSGPNIQQTEPSSRVYMVPDDDDHYFLICDYSQAEYRIMAGLSGEQKVIDFFNSNPEADYHILAYANMMHKAYEDVTTKERKVGKVLNFGTTYGLEDQNLALKLYGKDDKINQQMAHQAREDYFAGVPVLRDYFEAVRDEAETKGYTETWFGRRRSIPEFHDFKGNLISADRLPEYKRGSGRRKAGNMPVQGTAADITKMAMTRLRAKFREYGFYEDKARAVLNVHDEVCYCMHKSVHPWLATAIMREAMEIDLHNMGVNGHTYTTYFKGTPEEVTYANGIPQMYVGANVGYHWRDGKADDLEAPVILMDRMCKWAMDKFKAGEELPYLEDPREYWRDTITEFTMEVVHTEIPKGWAKGGATGEIIDLPTAFKNMRLAKYAHAFEEYENMVIMECIENKDVENFHHELFKKYDWYKGWNSPLAKQLVTEVSEIIEAMGYKTLEDLATNNAILNKLAYFGDYAGTIGQALLNNEDGLALLQKNVMYTKLLNGGLQDIYTKIESNYINSVKELMENEETFNAIKPYRGVAKEVVESLIKEGVQEASEQISKNYMVKAKKLSKPKEEKTGKQVQDELKTIEELVKNSLVTDVVVGSNGKEVGAKLQLKEDNAIVYNIVDSLLVSNRDTRLYKENNFFALRIVFANGNSYSKTGYVLPAFAGKLLRRLLREYYLDNEDGILEIQKEIPQLFEENLNTK